MKKLMLVVVLAVSLLTLGTGCKSVQTTSYNAVVAQPVTVESSLDTWNSYLKQHPNKVSLQQDGQVRAAFNHWKQTQLNVIQIGSALTSTNTPPDQKGQLESGLTQAVDAATSAGKTLTNLIATFTK